MPQYQSHTLIWPSLAGCTPVPRPSKSATALGDLSKDQRGEQILNY